MLKVANCSAVILAGGQSSRIGQDKGELFLKNKKIAQWTVSKVAPLFDEVIYATNKPELAPKNYALKILPDKVPYLGPLGALATALPVITNSYAFVIAYDLPFVKTELILFLVQEAAGFDVCVPVVNNKLQPLLAVYSKQCLTYINTQLSKGNRKLTGFFSQAQVKLIAEAQLKSYDQQLYSFFNINTWDDYKQAQQLAAELMLEKINNKS